MARISVEQRIWRGLAVAGLVLAACGQRAQSRPETEIAKEHPQACGDGEVYSPEEVSFPREASYLLERPIWKGCAVEIYKDTYQVVYLLIYRGKYEIYVFDDMVGRRDVIDTGGLPTEAGPVEFAFKSMKGKISLTGENNFLVEYAPSGS